MSGTDWLRNLVKQRRKPATGGLVTANQAATIVRSGCVHPGTGYIMPEPAPRNGLVYSNPTIQIDDAEPVPVINLTIETDRAEQQTADVVDVLRYAVRTLTVRTPSYRSDCGCWPQYAYCYCDLRKRAAR